MWTLENKWVRLIFNKYQITKEIQEDETVLMLSQCSEKDSALIRLSAWSQPGPSNRKTSERLNL